MAKKGIEHSIQFTIPDNLYWKLVAEAAKERMGVTKFIQSLVISYLKR